MNYLSFLFKYLIWHFIQTFKFKKIPSALKMSFFPIAIEQCVIIMDLEILIFAQASNSLVKAQ